MRTIERNYRKNPHTARFLQTFHSGIGTNGRDYRAEMAQAEQDLATDAHDLLDEVPVEAPISDHRSPAQADLMQRLQVQLSELDAETGRKALVYIAEMTEHGKWTAGREGNASAWITRMIEKVRELKATTPKAPAAEVEDGRYAVELAGGLRFFKVKNGRRAGMVFLDVQASDDWHAIRNLGKIREVLALIAADPKAAMVRYGVELGECGRCGRTLTSEYRKLGIGPICIDK
jgi:hypothetical protein